MFWCVIYFEIFHFSVLSTRLKQYCISDLLAIGEQAYVISATGDNWRASETLSGVNKWKSEIYIYYNVRETTL